MIRFGTYAQGLLLTVTIPQLRYFDLSTMGRDVLYHTPEARRQAARERQRRYYQKYVCISVGLALCFNLGRRNKQYVLDQNSKRYYKRKKRRDLLKTLQEDAPNERLYVLSFEFIAYAKC